MERVHLVQEMRVFHAEAKLCIEKLQLDLASALEQFAQLAAYVNGAAKTSVSDPQAFFSMLLTFARDLDAAHRDNLAADEQVSCFFCHACAVTAHSLLLGSRGNNTASYFGMAVSRSFKQAPLYKLAMRSQTASAWQGLSCVSAALRRRASGPRRPQGHPRCPPGAVPCPQWAAR